MIDSIKKAMLAGVGAAVITAEKVEETLSEWVKRGRVSAEDARAMASRIAEQGRTEFESSSQDLQKAIRELLEKAGVGQRDRIDSIEQRLLALEIEVANISTRLRSETPR